MYLPSGHPRAFAHSPPVQSHSFPTRVPVFFQQTTMRDILDNATVIVDPFKAYLRDNPNNHNTAEQLQVVKPEMVRFRVHISERSTTHSVLRVAL